MNDKKKRIQKIVIWVLGILLSLLILGGIGAWIYVHALLGRLNRPEPEPVPTLQETLATVPTLEQVTEPPVTTVAPTEPTEPEGDYKTNMLVIGQAYREGEETKLADSIILITIDRKTDTVTLTSFLRDLYIQMPHYKGHMCGQNRINVVYNLGWHWGGLYGGMEMMDMCLQQNFGVQVDHNVEIGFDTFSALVDGVGGIDLEITEQEAAYLNLYYEQHEDLSRHYEAGETHLDGDAALCYARIRKIDSDIARTERQRKVIEVLLDRCRNLSSLELTGLLYNLAPMVITDMSDDDILSLFWDVIRMLPRMKIESAMCPAPGTSWGKVIPLGGYLSGVIECNVQKNKEILVERCEVPKSAE